MEEKAITYRQGVILIILFELSSAIIFVTGIKAKQDVWLATILAMLFTLPIILMYERLLYFFPGKDLFDILQITFGKGLGKIISILYIWFSFHLGYLALRNFGDFISVIGLTDTPEVVTVLCIIVLGIAAVKYGIEVIGRWGEIAIVFLLVPMSISLILLLGNMDINNLKPVLYNGIKPVLKGTFAVISFPFAQLVIFTMVFTTFKEKGIPKVYRKGLILSGIFIIITSVSIILTLGVNTTEIYYFPSHTAVRRVNIGDFIQRIEITISLVYLIGGILKVAICLLVASKGVAKILNFKDYRFIVTPIGIMMVNFSILDFRSVMETSKWIQEVWPYYSLLFHVILPIIIFVGVEVKRKIQSKGV